MSELLTTRELQALLKVDRITVYRMLEQGRLPGFKVGGQWRFSRRQIDEWLEAQQDSPSLLEAASDLPLAPSESALPLHCAQNMQDVFADAMDVSAVTTDLTGAPLTLISNSCEFCNLVLATPEGKRRCSESWRPVGAENGTLPKMRLCHAGLLCASILVQVGGEPIAGFASCQFLGESGKTTLDWEVGLPALALDLGLDGNALRAAARKVRVLPDAGQPRLSRLLKRMSITLSDIGQERLALLGRLRSIAEMTKV